MLNQISKKIGLSSSAVEPKKDQNAPAEDISGVEKGNKSMFDMLKQSAQEKYDEFRQSEHVKRLSNAVSEKIKIIDNQLKALILAQKEKVNGYIKQKIEVNILEYMKKQQQTVARKLKDPDMFPCIKRAVDGLVEETWPVIMDEVKFQLRMTNNNPQVEVPFNKVHCCCLPLHCIRVWYTYSMQPYDKSIWKKFKTFSWWFFTLISIFPYFGVQACYFVFSFLCMDKSDEYQLVNYILAYKKMQFISQGFIQCSVGYFLYFNCVSMIRNSSVNPYQECADVGPGTGTNHIYDIVIYFSQIFFIWVAFFMLPCSKPKGNVRFKYLKKQEEQETEQDASSSCCCVPCKWSGGGALFKFMIYDALTFGVSIGVYFWTFDQSLASDLDQSKAQIFMAKIVYGILSLPFAIFLFSPLQILLTKSRPTAYDRYGNTVPSDKRVSIIYNPDEEAGLFDNQVQVDIEELFE